MSRESNKQHEVSAGIEGSAATSTFLDFIFEGTSTGFIEFRYFSPGRKMKAEAKSSYYSLPLDHDQIIEEVFTRSERQAISFSPAPRCRIPGKNRPAKDQDILQVGCLWANLDNKHAAGGAIEVLQHIRDFPLRPSLVVNSGYGYHLYFVFHSALNGSQLLDWSDMMRNLRAAYRIDERISLCQVMRLPGTLNLKEVHPVRCEISQDHSSWTRFSMAEVKEAIHTACAQLQQLDLSRKKGALIGHIQAPSVDEFRRRGLDLELIEVIITGRSISHSGVRTGTWTEEEGRDYRVAYELYKHGFEEEEIKAVFRANPNGCGSKWAQKRQGDKYLDSLLQKVINRYSDMASSGEMNEEDGSTHNNVLPPNYSLHEDGSIWFDPPVPDEGRKSLRPIKVSDSMVRIDRIQEDIDTGQITLVIAFDYLGKIRYVPILRSQMSDSRQLVTALSGQGAPVTSNNARLLTAYLAAYEHSFVFRIPLKKVTTRLGRGRTGQAFFLPSLSEDIDFVPTGPGAASFYRAYASRRGSLKAWVDLMHELEHARLMIPQIAVLTAFIPPLQRKLRIPNFILDIHGNTSTGKSTCLKLAASVYGSPHDPDSIVMQWMNTSVAVEQVAAMCSELPIFLDDAQHCPAEMKRAVIYMIANGRGKGRSGRGRKMEETATWHTVALSTSEEPLYEASPHEGARGRILSIGGQVPPFRPGTAALVHAFERGTSQLHGYAGEIYIRHLNGWTESDWMRWQRRFSIIRDELLKSCSSDIVGRVSGYIAAIQLAAEIICPLLDLSFKADIVSAWLMLHLDEQQKDQNVTFTALRALADYYIANINHFAGDGHYDPHKHLVLRGISKHQQYVGFLRSSIETIFVSRKWNTTATLNKLLEAGVLYHPEKDRYTKKILVNGIKHRMTCIKWSAMFPEDYQNPS